MSIEFDNLLEKNINVKWLPFVGDNYSKQSTKVLLIGESHYSDPNDANQNIQKPQFTRWIVNELGLCNRDYKDKSNFFKVINKMFAKDDLNSFWNKISFFNFVQRPMTLKDSRVERPNRNDYRIGWDSFFTTSKILKPDYCLFLGNTCGDTFNKWAEKVNISHEKITRQNKINGAYFKNGSITIEGHKIELYFIKHPSQFFSSNKWFEALKIKNENLIKALCE